MTTATTGHPTAQAKQVNLGPATTSTYTHTNQILTRGSTTFTHDLNGNRTGSNAGEATTYNTKDQASVITVGPRTLTNTYTGPGNGERTLVSQPTSTTTYTTGLLGLAGETTGATTLRYTKTPDGAPIGTRVGAARYYLLTDRQDSVTRMFDANGNITNSYRYDPYGKPLQTITGAPNAFRYHGGYMDDTGLVKMGIRYYDPTTATFTQVEPLKDTNTLRGIIDYTYAAGNPINYSDPSGASPLFWLTDTAVRNFVVPWVARNPKRAARAASNCLQGGTAGAVAGGAGGTLIAGPAGTVPGAVGTAIAGCGLAAYGNW